MNKFKNEKQGPLYGPFIFNVYKPKGMGSFDVVRHFKFHLPKGFGKIGHFGTLDPFAEGVLLIAIGNATKLTDLVHEMPKTYLAEGILGIHSSTGDLSDNCEIQEVDASGLKSLSLSELKEKLETVFLGDYEQVPPQFSATKHEGRSLYEWAREGVFIKKDAVKRFIHELEIVAFDFPRIIFRAKVSSGTYIRTLFEDMAHHLGNVGALKELKREAIGHISCEESFHENDWPTRGEDFDSSALSTSFSSLLPYQNVQVPEGKLNLILNGADVQCAYEDGQYWLFAQDELLGACKVVNKRLKINVRLIP